MPHYGTTKDIEITTVALMKSVIESGAEPDTWEERAKMALNIYSKLVGIQLKNKQTRSAS